MTMVPRHVDVFCDDFDCPSTLSVPAVEGESPWAFAARARDLLIEKGWSKNGGDQYRCPRCLLDPTSFSLASGTG